MKIGDKEWVNLIIAGAETFGIHLDRHQTDRFTIHATQLIHWNQKVNLTTITDPLDVGVKHFLDSLAPACLIPPDAALLDIGSGGGFPGIPLKVILPFLSVTMIDASRKKVNFIKHIIRTTQLDNIEALHTRAEDLADNPTYINRFDVIISRALSSLDSFVRLALPLLAKEGIIIALKGEANQKELDGLKSNLPEKMNKPPFAQNRYALSLQKYRLPFLKSRRSIISVKLTSHT